MEQAEQVRPERRQRAVQLIVELQNERKHLWAFYCQLGELKPFSDLELVKTKLTKFAEVLVDYVSLGHFGLYERILAGAERRESVKTLAVKIYPEFSKVTDMTVSFNDKYDKAKTPSEFNSLADDLSVLGESLAKRFDIEDQLCALMCR